MENVLIGVAALGTVLVGLGAVALRARRRVDARMGAYYRDFGVVPARAWLEPPVRPFDQETD